MDRLEQQIEETMLECSEPTRISIAFNSLAEKNGLEMAMRYETRFIVSAFEQLVEEKELNHWNLLNYLKSYEDLFHHY